MVKLIFTVVIFVAICACMDNRQKTAKTDEIEFDSFTVDTTVTLAKDTNAPRCNLSFNVQYAKGNHAAKTNPVLIAKINQALIQSGIIVPDYLLPPNSADIRRAVDLFVNKFVSEYLQDYGKLYREDQAHANSYNYDYQVRTTTQVGADNVIIYTATVYTYGGGAHGINQTLVKNIDAKTGRIITLKDIFVPGYEETLQEILLEKIKKKFNAKSLEALQQQYIFADGDIYVPDNFILNEDDIIFIYGEDEIAPHSIGQIRIEIDRDELNKIMK